MSTISTIVCAVGGSAIGGVYGERARQQRLARSLEGESADKWDHLGTGERYRVQRALRRGRTLADRRYAGMGADVAAALRAMGGRRLVTRLVVGFALALLALGAVTIANDAVALGVMEGVIAGAILGAVLWGRHVRERLAQAERANRALVET